MECPWCLLPGATVTVRILGVRGVRVLHEACRQRAEAMSLPMQIVTDQTTAGADETTRVSPSRGGPAPVRPSSPSLRPAG